MPNLLYLNAKDKKYKKLAKKKKKEYQTIIRKKEIMDWKRTQLLHDVAYARVNQMIETEFGEDVNISIEHLKITSEDPMECFEEVILGWYLLRDKILLWRPNKPRELWTDLEKEIVHILIVKEKVILPYLLNYLT